MVEHISRCEYHILNLHFVYLWDIEILIIAHAQIYNKEKQIFLHEVTVKND